MNQAFYWGCATSSHQVEGYNELNDWWAWEQQGKIKESSGIACDQYHRFPEDIAFISQLGHNSHRFSIEWSRLEPQAGVWNEKEFLHYEEVLKELAKYSIEPFVTLHHFTNPLWFEKLGGWLSPQASFYFLRYVKKAVERFSPYVRFWITVNEPMVYLYFAYLIGEWPPGMKCYEGSLKVLRHFMTAHIDAYDWIHSHYHSRRERVWVSLAKHVTDLTPCRSNSWEDRLTVWMRRWFVNDMMFGAFQNGFLFFPFVFCEFMPKKNTLDFIGINYYTRDFIRFGGWGRPELLGIACEKLHHHQEIRELNAMGWEVYPEGLYQILTRLKKYKLPIIITENGICTEDDTQRVRFIENHLGALSKAQKEGVDVRGYFYWSLLDNFEWAHGFRPRFGIVEVDYKTQKRKIRSSAQTLTTYCRKLSERGIDGSTRSF